MLAMFAKFFVFAFITRAVTLLGLLAGVQPSSRLSCTPTVAPFGPQACSGTTPVLVAGLNAPITKFDVVTAFGATTNRAQSQVIAPRSALKLPPAGLWAMIGTAT